MNHWLRRLVIRMLAWFRPRHLLPATDAYRVWSEDFAHSAREGLCVLDGTGNVRSMNATLCQWLGVLVPTVQDHHVSELADRDYREALAPKWGDIGEECLDFPLNSIPVAPRRWVSASGARLRESDGWAVVLMDITTRRQADATRAEALETSGLRVERGKELLAIAAHELRTPVTALRVDLAVLTMNLADLSLRHDERIAIRESTEDLARQVERLGRHIDHLLDMAQLSARRLTLQREHVDLADLVRNVVARMRREAARASCEVRVCADKPVLGTWDPFRLEQVVNNLLSNALKYAPGSPIEICIGHFAERAWLTVSDRGIGIDPVDHIRIFERFERVRGHAGDRGLGLGLWIVRSIVELHGGSVEVKSALGEGSVFRVELPI